VARHTASALKSFLKLVLKPRDPALSRLLYYSFTTVKHKPTNRHKLPSTNSSKYGSIHQA
jgi:hypothetical protein